MKLTSNVMTPLYPYLSKIFSMKYCSAGSVLLTSGRGAIAFRSGAARASEVSTSKALAISMMATCKWQLAVASELVENLARAGAHRPLSAERRDITPRCLRAPCLFVCTLTPLSPFDREILRPRRRPHRLKLGVRLRLSPAAG